MKARFAISMRGGQRLHRSHCTTLDAARENNEVRNLTRAGAVLWMTEKRDRQPCTTCKPSLLAAAHLDPKENPNG